MIKIFTTMYSHSIFIKPIYDLTSCRRIVMFIIQCDRAWIEFSHFSSYLRFCNITLMDLPLIHLFEIYSNTKFIRIFLALSGGSQSWYSLWVCAQFWSTLGCSINQTNGVRNSNLEFCATRSVDKEHVIFLNFPGIRPDFLDFLGP